MNEDETREALRRFINDWRVLIGSNPSQLSLIERVDRPDGTKIALYEQRPFRYPLRGDFGKLQIHFTGNRRLLNLTSSCIPDAERLQSALAGVTPSLTAETAIKHVRTRASDMPTLSAINKTSTSAALDRLGARYLCAAPNSGRRLSLHRLGSMVSNAPFSTVLLTP